MLKAAPLYQGFFNGHIIFLKIVLIFSVSSFYRLGGVMIYNIYVKL